MCLFFFTPKYNPIPYFLKTPKGRLGSGQVLVSLRTNQTNPSQTANSKTKQLYHITAHLQQKCKLLHLHVKSEFALK